jgi:mannose-6-phosphate isomerase class I
MFLIARKSDVRVKKTVPSLHQNVADLLLKNLSFDFLEVDDFNMTFVADYHLVYYVSSGQMRVIVHDAKYLLLKGDAVFIEQGMKYTLQGTFNATIVNRTAYVD